MRIRWLIFTLGILALSILSVKYSYGQQGKAPAKAPSTAPPMETAPRRVVLGNNPQGKSTVLFDGPAPWFASGSRWGVWETLSSPADNNTGGADALAGITSRPSDIKNTFFEVVEFPPGRGLVDGHLDGHYAVTPTVDYDMILTGEIDCALTDGSEVHLKTGDIIVIKGVAHGWTNRGTKPAEVLTILIGANPLPK